MSTQSSKTFEPVRLFDNDLIENLTHVRPSVPALIWVPVFSVLIFRAITVHDHGVMAMTTTALVGLLTWTLLEYGLHRFFFHWKPDNIWGKRFVYLCHGIHHDTPNDPTRLVMPPVVSITLGTLIFFIILMALPNTWGEPFFAFIVLGYLWYDYTHYYIHHAKPKSRLGQALKRYHMLHHYQSHDRRFGVSSPLWDLVFRTFR